MHMTTINRPHEKTITCMCGGTMDRKIGTITKIIRNEEIRIHHAPFYECRVCGEIEFELSARISSIAVDAYKNGIRDVVWNQDEPTR